jgi:vacuolar-type H+-ATPase subunit I/STV1
VVIYENTINKISKNDINDLNLWLSEVKTKNNYEHIDNLFSNNVLTLENKIKSKNIIVENLRNSPVKMEGTLNLPVKKLVDVANKTVNNFLESLNENSKKTLIKILSENEDKLKLKYEVLKETVVDKLEELKEIENETEVISRINETIGKIQKEKFDRINYFKLQELYKNI